MFKKIAAALMVATLLGSVGCASPKGPRFQNVGGFSEGVAPVQASNGKWGYINTQNQFVIPAKFDEAKQFQSSRAAVKLNGKWGFINKQGTWQ
jgi:hypothetical protein